MYLTCNISKSIRRPDRVVSDPIKRLKSSEKLENNAALAATRVRIFVFSSLGSRSAAGYPLNQKYHRKLYVFRRDRLFKNCLY